MDFNKITEKLENKDYKVVADLCALVNNDGEKETHLVDLLATYFEAVGQMIDLLTWAIQWEVQKTDTPNNLFRLESVATALMYRLFFTEKGMHCLKMTVCPLIERVSRKVEKHEDCDYTQNVKFILKETKKFISGLESAISFFPLEIREGLLILHREVQKKFPKTKNAVAVLLFLRFLCPSILQAQSFGIVKDPPPPAALAVLLQIAKLLQCIANEQIENKITNGVATDKILDFIEKSIPSIRAYTSRLVNEEEMCMLKKVVDNSANGSVDTSASASSAATVGNVSSVPDKAKALQNIIDYISGPEFPLPNLHIDSKARQLPTILKKRKITSLDNNVTVLENVFNSVKINLVYLLESVDSPVYVRMMDETVKIKSELDDLGVKQILITCGTLDQANQFMDNSRFRGEVYVDSSGKVHQLFAMRARKQSMRSLYTAKMQVIRSRGDKLELRTEKNKSEKEMIKPAKIYVLFGDLISFESKFEGTPEDLLNLLQACGAKPETLATLKNKLKKKRKSSFWTLKRTTSSFRI